LSRALEPLGAEIAETVEGDVTDAARVRGAMDGCDAVIHAANIFTYSSRFRREMDAVNVGGTELVLTTAAEMGLDPIVYVSSYTVLVGGEGPIPADAPVQTERNQPYIDSKRGGERIARRFQGQSVPVVTTYPGSVWGPHDPGAGEMVKIARLMLASPFTFGLDGHIGIVDVSWLARLHASLIEPGRGARRVLAPGITLSWRQLAQRLAEATGRRPPRFLPTPHPIADLFGRGAQLASRIVGVDIPIHQEGPWLVRHWQPGDDRLSRDLAGPLPPVDETIVRAAEWMLEAGHIRSRKVVATA
jgi:nucleoside-diphosphate-sugar epimerase